MHSIEISDATIGGTKRFWCIVVDPFFSKTKKNSESVHCTVSLLHSYEWGCDQTLTS